MIIDKICFELIEENARHNDDVVYNATNRTGTIRFQKTVLTEDTIDSLKEEIKEWEILEEYKWKEEDLVYNVIKSGSGTRVIQITDIESFWTPSHISNNLRGEYLIKAGQFIGIVLDLECISSLGMSYSSNKKYGVLLTNGQSFGQTSSYYSNCNTEKDSYSSSNYYLRKK